MKFSVTDLRYAKSRDRLSTYLPNLPEWCYRLAFVCYRANYFLQVSLIYFIVYIFQKLHIPLPSGILQRTSTFICLLSLYLLSHLVIYEDMVRDMQHLRYYNDPLFSVTEQDRSFRRLAAYYVRQYAYLPLMALPLSWQSTRPDSLLLSLQVICIVLIYLVAYQLGYQAILKATDRHKTSPYPSLPFLGCALLILAKLLLSHLPFSFEQLPIDQLPAFFTRYGEHFNWCVILLVILVVYLVSLTKKTQPTRLTKTILRHLPGLIRHYLLTSIAVLLVPLMMLALVLSLLPLAQATQLGVCLTLTFMVASQYHPLFLRKRQFLAYLNFVGKPNLVITKVEKALILIQLGVVTLVLMMLLPLKLTSIPIYLLGYGLWWLSTLIVSVIYRLVIGMKASDKYQLRLLDVLTGAYYLALLAISLWVGKR